MFEIFHFGNRQIALFLTATIFLITSLFFKSTGNNRAAIFFLAISAISIFAFSALLDSFLNVWDERFHALVAKNMMNHMLVPTLYDDPVLDMEYKPWDRFHIWLQKQPLFLWQIAISFKILGVSEFALRLPSVVLTTMLVLIGYRSGKLLANENVGYFAAFFIVSSNYFIELIAGRQELDHNDVSFIVYISLSIWAFIEYHFSNKKIWVLLIGIFSGCAILCKWATGLLVYSGWIVLSLFQKKHKLKENADLFSALLITFVVSAPWQLYTFIKFPKIATETYIENASHFTEVLQGHGGTAWYHFDKMGTIYGSYSIIWILPALYFFYNQSNSKKLAISLVFVVSFVYIFFTLAATKMPSFTSVNFLIIAIAFGSLADQLLRIIDRILKNKFLKQFVFIGLMIFLFINRFNPGELYELHADFQNNHHIKTLTENARVFKSISLPANYVLFNIPGRHFIEAMFYTGLPCYGNLPTKEQYQDLKNKGREIAINNSKNAVIPEHLAGDSKVIYLDKEINISE